MLDIAPLGVVAVTVSGYDPAGVAAPLGDFGRLPHADIPTAKKITAANETAHRGCFLNVPAAPHKDNIVSISPRPVPNPPGIGAEFGTKPLQYVWTTMATSVVFPVIVTALGTILHVMFGEELAHVSCTVPVKPGAPVSSNPKVAFPPGVVFAVEELPWPILMTTGLLLLNVAVTDAAALSVTAQVAVPEQPAPLQPPNVEPCAADAVNVTCAPLAKFAEHAEGQLIPEGTLFTVPVPVPASVTVSETPPLAKFADTESLAVMVNVQAPVPSQISPPQPVKIEPAFGVAVSVTWVSPAKVAEQVSGQLIPPGELVTLPGPVTVTVTDAPPVPERSMVCTLPEVGPLSEIVIVAV